MEGEPGVVRDEPVVLWEKRIQQSIIVDLSEDESIHLSDLESSLAFHISQVDSAPSEASVHLSGSAEMSDYDNSSESIINSHHEGHMRNHTRSNEVCVSVLRPNTAVQDVPSQNLYNDDPGQSTSDEDHEELPYDGDLGSLYFNRVAHSDISQDGRRSSCNDPDLHHLSELIINDAGEKELAPVKPTMKATESLEENAKAKQDKDSHMESEASGSIPFIQLPSKDDLLRSGRLIEAETLPEVSLLDSMDEILYSRASVHSSKNNPCYHGLTSISKSNYNSYSEQKSTANVNMSLLETENIIKDGTSSIAEIVSLNSYSNSSKHQIISETWSDEAEEEMKNDKAPLLRARSFNEIKYGQGQVHYPLPDFSKVAPKIKIPKTSRESLKPMPQPPSSIHRAHSSPDMLDVVSRVLEDSVFTSERPSVFIEPDKSAIPALVQHLQDKYDKLLTKYAEAETLIDRMRLGTKAASAIQLRFDDSQNYVAEGSILNPLEKLDATQCTDNDDSVDSKDGPSDGELMTTELSNIATQFMQNVDDFKYNVSNKSINLEEQQMMLRILMEAQDQLERKYISKKEEHRALEMQKYMGINRNTGTFDPDRLVEGGIFRLGMLLEDIKDMIDKNMCDQISLPQSSSTPRSFNVHIRPHVLCMSPPTAPLSLHEDQTTSFSAVANEMEITTEASTGQGDYQVEQNNEHIVTDHTEGRELHSYSWSPHAFQTVCLTSSEEHKDQQDEESVLTEWIRYSNILAYFDLTKTSSRETLPISRSTQDRAQHLESDLDNCVSLSVEVSCSSEDSKGCDSVPEPLLKTSVSQRNMSPETDSGFGSSYLNQFASGSFQQNLNESFQSQKAPISSSDSEGSCSNLQTTIEPVTKAQRAVPPVRSEQPGASNPVQQCLESTTKEAIFRVQGTKHHYMSEPMLGRINTQGSPVYSCSCNNEAILALQSEVSRLKKDMEEGLIQLPYLTDKLDYLSSKYRHERSKSRSRSHQRLSANSPLKSPTIGLTLDNTSPSPVNLEWMSTYIDPARNKDTEDTTASDMQFDYSPIEGGRGSDFLHLDSGLHSPGAGLSSRGFTEKWSPIYSTAIHKPLLQVNYGSSSSLPASYKLREYPLQPAAYNRKRSTQSDSALLPSNVFFQRTMSPLSAPSKLGGRTTRHSQNKEEDIHRTLDKAIEVAHSMKKTTDRMAKCLSADLAKARQKKLYRGRKHHDL
ncbi:microtubule organization protein AKNA-like [Boleophthalmus pectinirostris]|uniref:microtubule organization protein AKNA-like n=1 Tax=Boleophthalmus pectinirostris TaxID=150288 RepID=UPI00242AFD61|nr:microtubule organization protein AKNA-like [Boleophthalmus pectinirostris]